ncbi:LysR family transcriptional regulator [Paraburkholderia sediminicola]|uniref:LysR family transcriptional regulator n=1 Tax=Paraburkholderia sediminicola TaxID=458836 RepID=UPI0038B99B9B
MEILSHMRLFVEVARTKSFRGAAAALVIPISTVSRGIAELEKEIGLRLLNRSTRRVELTDAGEMYFKRCQNIVAEALIAHEELRDMAERPTGTLRVSMPLDFAIDYLAPIMSDFAKAYPLVHFSFDVTPRRVDLQAEPFDLAIRIGPPPDTPSMLVARQLAVLPRNLYAAPGYLMQAAPLHCPQDLKDHTFCIGQAIGRHDATIALTRGSETVEVPVAGRFAMNGIGLSRTLAALGNGIVVLNDWLARDDIASGRLQRVLPEWSLPPVSVHAITETRLLPARTRVFIDYLKARLGDCCATVIHEFTYKPIYDPSSRDCIEEPHVLLP